jgi:nucleoside-diphosphate-sugar epimerase
MLEHINQEPLPPRRVVVLGAGGFIGKTLVRHLREAGMTVLGLSSSDVDLSQSASVAELRSRLGAGDAVVLLSAITRDRGEDVTTFMTNVAIGGHVSRSIPPGSAQVICVSSDAVYGDEAANPVTEASPCSPSGLYGLSHLVRERLLEHVLRRVDVPLAILRPTMLYGPGDTHGSYGPNRFFRSVRDSRGIDLFGEGEELRDHVYVNDFARLVAECLVRRSRGVLNVATGESMSFREVARIVASLAGGGIELRSQPRSVPITHRYYDTSAIARAFPSMTFTRLDAGLLSTWSELAVSAGLP